MKFEEIVQEVSLLRNRLRDLENRIRAIEISSPDGSLLSTRLKERGLKIYRQNPREKLLIPPDLSPELTTQFYEKMRKYSFRLFLRDVINKQAPFCPGDLTQYCSNRVAEEYNRFLSTTSTVVPLQGDRYRLNRSGISSFGPTLEWFVAEMFQREFACPAIYGVHFRETDVGGDYDVLALWEGRIVYVEVKSSPPKSIEDEEVKAFFLRIYDLIPDVALFFNDTHLRMMDKVIEIFKRNMERIPKGESLPRAPERLKDEIYHVDHWIYILNSKRDIVGNFRMCLRNYLRKSRDLSPSSLQKGS